MPVIDIHTHVLGHEWLELLRAHGAPRYGVTDTPGKLPSISCDGAPFLTPSPAHFDYELRIRDMDAAGVDIGILSLTCPNVYWGSAQASLRAARSTNEEMAAAQLRYPDRLRWMTSLPWMHVREALDELYRARDAGAVGVMVLANIDGLSLTDQRFAPVWKAIDSLGLAVLVHPGAPPGTREMSLNEYALVAAVGFMFDTTLAITRMMFDGFLDRYPNLNLIVGHAGATLPYVVGRLDACFEKMPATRTRTSTRPSDWLRRMYYDTVTYSQEALDLCIAVCGSDHVMYGSDYPHNIGDMAGCLARVDALPSACRDAVRGHTAARVFGLE